MDFDRLPNEIRLKIFMQLPFKDRVRLARVSKGFQEMSTMAVSQTTVFDIAADISENLDEESVERLIKSFAGNLRRVVQSRIESCRVVQMDPQFLDKRVEMLSQCLCPRLQKLDLGIAKVANATLRNLLGKCPNLRSLESQMHRHTFPSGVVCEKLEEVDIGWCTPEFFESLAQSCPNLKRIALEFNPQEQPKRWEQLLNKIFADKPELEMLKLKDWRERIRIEKMESLWSLAELRSLSLECREISDETMFKISKCFGQLECLRLELFDQPDRKVPSRRGIEALSKLKHLRELAVFRNPCGGYDIEIDRGAWCLAECGRLRVVRFRDPLSPATMRAFVQRCPMLRRLSVWSVEGVDTSDAAKQFVESLSGFVQEHLEIALTCFDTSNSGIWLNREVQEAVDHVNATADGRSITITILIKYHWNDPDDGHGDYINIGPSMYKRTAGTWIEWSKWYEENTALKLTSYDDTIP